MAGSSLDPSTHPSLSESQAAMVRQIADFTKTYFQNPKFDASHDIHHVMRVTSNTIFILDKELSNAQLNHVDGSTEQGLSAYTAILGALLHDVDDRKYIDVADGSGQPSAKAELLRVGMSESEAQKIQTMVEGVSYSSESKDPERTKALIREVPELAVVQDADRLDAIGAIGVGRCFTFGGAKRSRTLDDTIQHFHDKLLKLESVMKTKTGKEMAAERSKRMREFLSWWQDETDFYSH